jgi:flagellar hook assembly protein FlgD
VIWYFLPDVGYQPAEAEITVYNVLGKVVRRLVSQRQYPGEHKVTWDGKDDSGKEVASGIYFCRLKVSGLELVQPRKMVLLR